MGYKVDKPWGHEQIWAHCEKYVGKLLVINPGEKLSRQYHEVKDETIFVLKGELVLEIGRDDEIERLLLGQGASYRVKPGTIHRFCAPSTGCTLIEVSTPELEDVVRVEDDYGRD
jgi:mannose-6-phosphate isomerase